MIALKISILIQLAYNPYFEGLLLELWGFHNRFIVMLFLYILASSTIYKIRKIRIFLSKFHYDIKSKSIPIII